MTGSPLEKLNTLRAQGARLSSALGAGAAARTSALNEDDFTDPLGLLDPGPPSFAPIDGHPHLESDTPLLATMLLDTDEDAPWRAWAGAVARAVAIRPRTPEGAASGRPDPLLPLALEPSAVHDPPVQPPAPWEAMRRAALARSARPARPTETGTLRLPGLAQGEI